MFIGLPSLVGFVMGLPSWMGFGCGYAAMGCGFVAMDRFCHGRREGSLAVWVEGELTGRRKKKRAACDEV